MIRIIKHQYLIINLVGIFLLGLGSSCKQTLSNNFKVFDSINFENDDYKLYGFMMEGEKTRFEDEVGDFYISDRVTLQKMKDSWIVRKTEKRMPCDINYLLLLVNKDSIVKNIGLNTKCKYLICDTCWCDFNESLLSENKGKIIKIPFDSARMIQEALMNKKSKK